VAEAPVECYFVDPANKQQGPVGSADIVRLVRNGTIRRDTLIWYTGMQDWRPAGEVSGLASLFGGAAPPAQSPPRPRPPASSQAPAAGGYAAPQVQAHAQAYATDGAPSMNFVDAVKTCFRKYVDFNGRARRSEYWWFILFYTLLMIALIILDTVIALAGLPLSVLTTLGSLAMFLPSLSAVVRRLHDTDRSGWMFLIGLIPLVGGIILLVFTCQRGTPGDNRFGPDPLGSDVAATFE
jgi:uncharacterized membrane protein YhaH (DUF805 family)